MILDYRQPVIHPDHANFEEFLQQHGLAEDVGWSSFEELFEDLPELDE